LKRDLSFKIGVQTIAQILIAMCVN